MQKFTKAEHFSGKIGGPSGEGMRDVGMYSMEGAKPGFGKINQWTRAPQIPVWTSCTETKQVASMYVHESFGKNWGKHAAPLFTVSEEEKKKRKSKYFSTF